MSILFKPYGTLDVATEPADLDQEVNGAKTMSGAMKRLKNLRIDRKGNAETRYGSVKINTTAIAKTINLIKTQGGERYTFSTAIYLDETSIASGLSSSVWSAILYNSFSSVTENVFALNGTDRKRIEGSNVYEWGLEPPTVAASVYPGEKTGLTGEYGIRYTYARKEELVVVCESDPSPVSNNATLDDGSLGIILTQPEDTQVTHIRIYRTLLDGVALYYHDQDIEIADAVPFGDYGYMYDWEESEGYLSGDGDKVTTTDGDFEVFYEWETYGSFVGDETEYVDFKTGVVDYYWESNTPLTYRFDLDTNTADGALGSLVQTDHDRPPLGTFVLGPSYNGTCFIIKDNLVYYSSAKQPEYWPSTQFIEASNIQFPGKTLVYYNGQVHYLTEVDIFYIQGTGLNTFFPIPTNAVTGTKSAHGAIAVEGKGVFHVGSDGIYLFDGQTDPNVVDSYFRPIFHGQDINDVKAVKSDLSNSWLIRYKNKIYFGYPGASETYPTNALVLDLKDDKWAYFTWNIEIRAVEVDEINDKLLGAGNDGFVWQLEKDTAKNDAGTEIEWDVESKEFTLQTRKHFPRWVKYDVDASAANCTATGEVMLDGVSHQTHSITQARKTKRRLVEIGNGNRESLRVRGSGTVKIYAIEGE